QTLIHAPLRLARPDAAVIGRIVGIGLPSAVEFLLMFVTMSVIYVLIRDFGAEAQAGFGVGSRVMQAVFLPAMAVSFAVAPVAGQNFGAGLPDRVRRTVRDAALISSVLMAGLTALCLFEARWLVAPFTPDPAVAEVAATYLRIVSLNFIATGLIFTASGTFQALGDTRPALAGGLLRLVVFVTGAVWISTQPWAKLEHIWWMSAASALIHAVVALLFLRRQLMVKLAGLAPRALPASEPAREPASIPEGYVAVGQHYSDTSEVPKDRDLFYRCGTCGGRIPSLPKDNIACECGGVSIDKDMSRLWVADLPKLMVLRKTS
ncbi:MAG TPA: MATE family efflux transporter, partial [Brevundimonas sp.]|nr:MATE family efflux transporter [Brevundimonas sp.]